MAETTESREDFYINTLKQILTKEEFQDYCNKRYIEITGSDGHKYRVGMHGDYQGNVVQLHPKTGLNVASLCIHPRMYSYTGVGPRLNSLDAYVAQILMIKTDAVRFLNTACGGLYCLPPREGSPQFGDSRVSRRQLNNGNY